MKVTETQLKKLQDFNQFMINASSILGDLQLQYESKKAQVINEIVDNQKQFDEFKQELENEYGNVEVNIQTGEIIIKKEQEETNG